MDADEVVIHEMQSHRMAWFSTLFEKALVNLVILRECIRTFRLFRSA